MRSTISLISKNDPRYNMEDPMDIEWTDGFMIRVDIVRNTAVISANREGLLSLQKQLAVLADAAPGSHIHYDKHNSPEEGSAELIISRE